jgi:DNA-binding transcriptional LysR family regulator
VAPSGELVDQLRAGALDVAVVVEPPTPAAARGLDLVPLLSEPLVVVAPEGREVGPPGEWGPWVLFPQGSHTRATIESELRELGAPVEVVAESHQPEVLREMARLGVGWTVLPEAQARAGRGRGGKGVSRTLTTRRLVVARRSGRVDQPTADRFVAALGT